MFHLSEFTIIYNCSDELSITSIFNTMNLAMKVLYVCVCEGVCVGVHLCVRVCAPFYACLRVCACARACKGFYFVLSTEGIALLVTIKLLLCPARS